MSRAGRPVKEITIILKQIVKSEKYLKNFVVNGKFELPRVLKGEKEKNDSIFRVLHAELALAEYHGGEIATSLTFVLYEEELKDYFKELINVNKLKTTKTHVRQGRPTGKRYC